MNTAFRSFALLGLEKAAQRALKHVVFGRFLPSKGRPSHPLMVPGANLW